MSSSVSSPISVAVSGATGSAWAPVDAQPDHTVSAINALTHDILVANQGKPSRIGYHELIDRLIDFQKKCEDKCELLPREHQEKFLAPFLDFLVSKKCKEAFGKIFPDKMAPPASSDRDPAEDKIYKVYRKLIPIAREALLQRDIMESGYDRDLHAFQMIVSDLFARAVVQNTSPDEDAPPLYPLVIWTDSDTPWTYPKEILQKLDKNMGAGVVGLPSQFRHGGLAAWGALGHEVAGHNLLHAIPNLLEELRDFVVSEIRKNHSKEKNIERMVSLWSNCVEETASDILGILALGPSSLISMLAYFRGKREQGALEKRASRHGNRTHPPDYLRIFMGVLVIQQFSFLKINDLTDSLRRDIERDKPTDCFEFIKLDEKKDYLEFEPMPVEVAIKMARTVVDAITNTKFKCLRKLKVTDLINWTQDDEEKAKGISDSIVAFCLNPEPAPKNALSMAIYPHESDARHVLAGALIACSSINSPDLRIKNIFDTMKELLALRYHTVH
ncbi:MAG: hypothetical protein K940chlam7_00480 [Chlamydiae bacterium]|nr:hypothetical protein [Chlamydiota bacterium]